ncbi:hypothetical protein JCM5350_006883 [Sporobolomyces pararoseus]
MPSSSTPPSTSSPSSSSEKIVSPTNSTTVAPPLESYQRRAETKETSDRELLTRENDPTTQARAEGLKGKNDGPLTEEDLRVLDPISHRPEGGEWVRD